jgi:hypothetical protein
MAITACRALTIHYQFLAFFRSIFSGFYIDLITKNLDHENSIYTYSCLLLLI